MDIFKLGNEMWKAKCSTWRERGTKKKSEFTTGIEPMTSRTTGGRSIHGATRTQGKQGLFKTEFICGRRPAYYKDNNMTRKWVSSRQELNPWPTEQRAGALSNELRELVESELILLS